MLWGGSWEQRNAIWMDYSSMIIYVYIQEKENRRQEMLELQELQEANKTKLENLHSERRKKAKVQTL
jgi:hypothetical protein